MKKVLLATTVLAMSAGFAAAQGVSAGVSISGDGRMGIEYFEDRAGGTDEELKFTARTRITFTLAGVTDNGLSFGGSMRADNAGASAGNIAKTGGTVFISGDFGTLTMGDTAGAARTRVGDLSAVSLTGLGDRNNFTYIERSFNNDTSVLYTYVMEGFAVSLSTEQTGFNDTIGIGVSYSFGDIQVSAGYENSDLGDHWIIGARAGFQGVGVRAIYGRANNDLQAAAGFASRDQYGLSVDGSFDAFSYAAFIRRDFNDVTVYGLGARTNLGGGASLVGGISAGNSGTPTRADFGIAMSF